MDNLKLYAKSEREFDSLIQTVRIFSNDAGMLFSLEKWAVLVLKRGNMVRTEEIELPGGKCMREVNLDGYMYLGTLQFDSIMNLEMKKKVKSEYIGRVKKLLRLQLNGGNVIAGMNAWTRGIIRYGARVLHWIKEEVKSIDIKTRKLMTIDRSLHPRGNVGRFYIARKEGGKGLISCKECVIVEVQSLGKYLSESKEWMLKFVVGKKGLSEVEDPDEFRKSFKKKKRSQWLEKLLHGRLKKDTKKVSTERTWQWLNRGYLKKETEVMVYAVQK